MKKYLSNILIIGLVIAILIFLWRYYFQPSYNTQNRYMTVVPSSFVEQVAFSGTVVPLRETFIVAPYTGYIKKLYVKIGEKVKKGDPVVSIAEPMYANEKVYPLRATHDGTVVMVNNSEGESVSKDDTSKPIVQIDDLNKFYIKADVPELNILKLKTGMRAQIQVIPITDRTYQGVISSIAMSPGSSTGAYIGKNTGYPVKIAFSNKDSLLKSGMSAIVRIKINEQKSTLTLPHEFVLNKGKKYYAVLKGGKQVSIDIGDQTSGRVIIKKGLTQGDVVQQVDYFNDQDSK